jgi:flagellar basal body-associated protein FliL
MRLSGKRILVIIIMAVLVSSIVAGAMSYFNRSSSTANNNQILLNERVNNIVDFCINSLPNGTTMCDSRLGPLLNKICNGENNTAQQSLDACHDGKMAQYYKVRNDEINKRNTMVKSNNNGAGS